MTTCHFYQVSNATRSHEQWVCAQSPTHAVYQMHVTNGFGDLVSYAEAEDRLYVPTPTAQALLGSVGDWRIEQMLAWRIVHNIPLNLQRQLLTETGELASRIWPSADMAARVAVWLTYQSLRLYPILRRPSQPEETGRTERFSAFYEAVASSTPFTAALSSLTAPGIPAMLDIEQALHQELPSWSERHDAIDRREALLADHHKHEAGNKGAGMPPGAGDDQTRPSEPSEPMAASHTKEKYGC